MVAWFKRHTTSNEGYQTLSIEHCASTCRGRQAEVADLGLEIGRIATSALSQCGEDSAVLAGPRDGRGGEIARDSAVSYSGAPRLLGESIARSTSLVSCHQIGDMISLRHAGDRPSDAEGILGASPAC